MSISKEQVHKVALLARLDLNSDELETMTEQLGQIVDYVNLLSELDTEAIQPLAHPLDLSNVFAADQTRPSLDRDDALSGAPHHNGECYLVPAVLGE